jgi:excisionase family DNA binding protein
MQTTEFPPLLSVRQVASRLAVTTRTVWKWAAAGRLPAPKYIGARLPRWELADIEHFIKTAPTEPPHE